MTLVKAKPPSERNKTILAVVLGAIAVISLAYMFLGSSSKSGTQVTKSSRTQTANKPTVPTPEDVLKEETGFIPRPIGYDPLTPGMPEAGRNIFAFYVPPPTPVKPAPTQIPTPTPVPPNLVLNSISPVNVYAHTGDFTLDVTGDKFTPATRIYIGGAELQTRFVSPQQLSTKVPAQLISFEGAREIVVRSPDGKLFSNTATLNVMPAPVPNYTLIGVTIRRGGNNTATLKEKAGKELMSVQLGDILGGRFRVTSISVRDIALIDTNLKIKHTLPLVGDSSSPGASGPPRYTPPLPPAPEEETEP